jgi:hypothetical protein
VLLTIHKKTPQIITQLRVANVHNDDNHEVVFVKKPWQSTTLGYNLPKTSASTPITTLAGFQNQPPHTDIHLVPINLEME